MRLFVYVVFDSCAAVYDRPFCSQADGEAVRSFSDIAMDKEHPIGKHPEHYSIYRIGEYDTTTAIIKPEDGVCLARAHELVALAANGLPEKMETSKKWSDGVTNATEKQ